LRSYIEDFLARYTKTKTGTNLGPKSWWIQA